MDLQDPYVRDLVHRWNQHLDRKMPDWFEWAVAAAQYHLTDCNWNTGPFDVGHHCSCNLTRVIAKIIEEAQRGTHEDHQRGADRG